MYLNSLQRVVLNIENNESVAKTLARFLLSDDLYAGIGVKCGMMAIMMNTMMEMTKISSMTDADDKGMAAMAITVAMLTMMAMGAAGCC